MVRFHPGLRYRSKWIYIYFHKNGTASPEPIFTKHKNDEQKCLSCFNLCFLGKITTAVTRYSGARKNSEW